MTTTTPKPRSKRALIITGAAAFVLGVGFGAAPSGGGNSPPTDASPPEPAPTVTVTAEPEAVGGTPAGTPDVCVTALHRADEVMALSAEVHGLFAGFLADTFPAAIEAAATWDVDGIDAATAQIAALNTSVVDITAQVEKVDYRAAADECLAGAS